MRELQNGYLAVMGLIIVTVIACTSAIGEDTFVPAQQIIWMSQS